MKEIYQQTEFNTIYDTVAAYINSDYGKALFAQRQPATSVGTIEKRLAETAEAMTLMASGQHVPFMGLTKIMHLTKKMEKGQLLMPDELTEYADFLRSFRLIRRLFEKNQFQTPVLNSYTQHLADFSDLAEEILKKIIHSQVHTDASRELRKIRGTITRIEQDIEKTLGKYVKAGQYLQDKLFVKKEDRYTLPVKAEFQNKINGQIIEKSNRGTTVFIEPSSVAKLNERLILIKAEETAEVYQILAYLTGLIAERLPEIQGCLDIVVELDVIVARAKYSRSIDGTPVTINNQDQLYLDEVYHPLLGSHAVPLTLALGESARGLIITGPNAGGKTLVLKTVGLVYLMTSFGLFIKHSGKTTLPLLDQVYLDIGDHQSLENSLSTFSGHMNHIAEILAKSSRHSLVLLDEIGSGTEPNEGAALAIAIMEALYQKGALIIATTHYGEIKDYALRHEDFQTAAMAFDPETLTPRYRLLPNQVGNSNAFWIAEKMKIANDILKQARHYLKTKQYQTQKQIFFQPQKVKTEIVMPEFQKGDRVWLTENGQIGLFYETTDEYTGRIFVDKQWLHVPLKRMILETKREHLYPTDYDLESLFADFHEQKFQRDIERGSKKAQKKLRKEAEHRRG